MTQSSEAVGVDAKTLGEDWRIIESLLPAGWMDKARELGAFRRARGFASPRELLQALLIHLGEGCGLRETAVRAKAARIAEVSDVALLKRLKSCEHWFEWMNRQLRASLQPRESEASGAALGGVPALLGARRLRVVDGSMVSEPGPTGSQWRLHYAIGLPGLSCQEVHRQAPADGPRHPPVA